MCSAASFPPIKFFYSHLHDAIRSELQTLSNSVLSLEPCEDLAKHLCHLKDRYRFLGQIYKYHSSVEDEVVYPALDSKVRNVTLAYSVEHEDEEQLFVQLSQLISKALQETGKEQAITIRLLACKVEEIHTTLRKHLAKEEEQLLPLLLRHFSFGEQAELVAQFLCCIPLSTVQQVLAWLKSTMPLKQQAGLQYHVGRVVSDSLLQQLLVAWLQPWQAGHAVSSPGAAIGAGSAAAAAEGGAADRGSPKSHTGAARSGRHHGGAVQLASATDGTAGDSSATVAAPGSVGHPVVGSPFGELQPGSDALSSSGCDQFVCCHKSSPGRGGTCRYQRDLEDGTCSSRPPLREIVYFHQAIRSALSSFAEETRLLREAGQQGAVTPAQLQALVERHRFIRAVCLFHSVSEDEVGCAADNVAVVHGCGVICCNTNTCKHTCVRMRIHLLEYCSALTCGMRPCVQQGRKHHDRRVAAALCFCQ